MKLIHLTLDQLSPSRVNVRKKGGKEIADLLPSIRRLGILQPLLVRASADGRLLRFVLIELSKADARAEQIRHDRE